MKNQHFLRVASLKIEAMTHLFSFFDKTETVLRTSSLSGHGNLQSWTKVLRQFTKINAFELTTEHCIWMKTSFSSVVTTSSPPTMFENASWMFSCFHQLKKNRAEFTPRKKVSNFHASRQRLSMIVARSDSPLLTQSQLSFRRLTGWMWQNRNDSDARFKLL